MIAARMYRCNLKGSYQLFFKNVTNAYGSSGPEVIKPFHAQLN